MTQQMSIVITIVHRDKEQANTLSERSNEQHEKNYFKKIIKDMYFSALVGYF